MQYNAPVQLFRPIAQATEGLISDGYLTGDCVCHLASLIYWAARDAGLTALAPTNHDFTTIPEVPKEYGVSIYFTPGAREANAQKKSLYHQYVQ